MDDEFHVGKRVDATLHDQKIRKVAAKNLRFYCREMGSNAELESFGFVQWIKEGLIRWEEIGFSLTETVQSLKARILKQAKTVSVFGSIYESLQIQIQYDRECVPLDVFPSSALLQQIHFCVAPLTEFHYRMVFR